MHAKTPDELPPGPDREYDTQGLLSPELAKEWVEEIKRRESDPAYSGTIDADEACALARAILRPRS